MDIHHHPHHAGMSSWSVQIQMLPLQRAETISGGVIGRQKAIKVRKMMYQANIDSVVEYLYRNGGSSIATISKACGICKESVRVILKGLLQQRRVEIISSDYTMRKYRQIWKLTR